MYSKLLQLVHKVLDYFNLSHWCHAEQTDQNIIPKDLYFVWLGSEVSSEHQNNIATWQRYNPDYKYHLLIDSAVLPIESARTDMEKIRIFCQAKNVILHDINDEINEPELYSLTFHSLYHDWVNGEDKVYAFASEFLRLHCLLRGGVYSDVDVICNAALGDLTSKHGFKGLMCGASKFKKIKDIWFFAAAPGSAIIKRCLEEMESYYNFFVINGHAIEEIRADKEVVHKQCSEKHRASMLDKIKHSTAMNTAYNNFRFKHSRTEGSKVNFVGGKLVINKLNEIANEKCGEAFEASLFVADGILEHKNDASWCARRDKQRTTGVRGVTIEALEVGVEFEPGENISVSREALELERDAQLREYGIVVNPRLQSLLAPNRLVERLNGF